MIKFSTINGFPYGGIDLLTAERIMRSGATRLAFSECVYVGMMPAEAVNLVFNGNRNIELAEVAALASELRFNPTDDLVDWEEK